MFQKDNKKKTHKENICVEVCLYIQDRELATGMLIMSVLYTKLLIVWACKCYVINWYFVLYNKSLSYIATIGYLLV